GVTAQRAAMASGAAAVAVLAVLTALTAPVDLVLLAASLVPLVLLVRLAHEAASTGRGHWPALASLAAGGLWLVALSGWASTAAGPLRRWPECGRAPVSGA